MAGIDLLSTRREKAIETFALKSLNGQYSHWFPPYVGRGGTRAPKKYKETYARCERMKNTPIFHMRRVLNRIDQ